MGLQEKLKEIDVDKIVFGLNAAQAIVKAWSEIQIILDQDGGITKEDLLQIIQKYDDKFEQRMADIEAAENAEAS